ncbi:MAG: ArsR/SmtB family transcription factor [Anaerolineae bacterium]
MQTDETAAPARTTNAELLARLKALADPTRLAIIELLLQGTQCNCEIAPALDLSLSLVSHHMRILREAGLVLAEHEPRDARWVYYTLAPGAVAELRRELDALLDPARIRPREACCGPDACRTD